MSYFTEQFIEYLEGLARNNNRDWYHAHKREYEDHVKRPFNDFVADIIDRVSLIDSSVEIRPKDAVFRIARDIRFAKDKTPYKTHVAAVISREGRRDTQYPALYFHFGADGVGIGGGLYQPNRENILKIRRAIKRDGAALVRALNGKRFKELYGGLLGEKNVRLPKQFASQAERYPFIANKQFYYFAEYDDPRLVLRQDLPNLVMRHYKAGQKVNEFLARAVG
jgi:uncharacterized protein (TIGR02453 family)